MLLFCVSHFLCFHYQVRYMEGGDWSKVEPSDPSAAALLLLLKVGQNIDFHCSRIIPPLKILQLQMVWFLFSGLIGGRMLEVGSWGISISRGRVPY